MIQQLKEWFQPFDLDVRKSNNARFTDQKVIPDVLCAVRPGADGAALR